MGFSEYSVFWKVGSGFETLTSRMAPFEWKNSTKAQGFRRGHKTLSQAVALLSEGTYVSLEAWGFWDWFHTGSTQPGRLCLWLLYQAPWAVSEQMGTSECWHTSPKIFMLFCRMCIYRCLLLVSPASSERKTGRKKPAESLSWCQLTASGRESLVLDVRARLV